MVNFSTSTSPKLGRRAAATPAATLKAFPRRGPRSLASWRGRRSRSRSFLRSRAHSMTPSHSVYRVSCPEFARARADRVNECRRAWQSVYEAEISAKRRWLFPCLARPSLTLSLPSVSPPSLLLAAMMAISDLRRRAARPRRRPFNYRVRQSRRPSPPPPPPPRSVGQCLVAGPAPAGTHLSTPFLPKGRLELTRLDGGRAI